MCVSSCDDFVWRMKEFSGAKIMGQPQAADATYSRIFITFYLDKNGNIAKKYSGDGQKIKINGQKLAEIRIPYSKTVDKNGKPLQGTPAKLDKTVAVTKSNFANIENDVVNEALQYIKK